MTMDEPHQIFLKRVGEGQVPSKAHPTDAGWDLHCAEYAYIAPRETRDIRSDIGIAMPQTLWGRIVGRSSTARKRGLWVVEGVIDPGYRGELFVCVTNITDEPVCIQTGDRLAQLIFHQIVDVQWVLTQQLPPGERGEKGFGSSGK